MYGTTKVISTAVRNVRAHSHSRCRHLVNMQICLIAAVGRSQLFQCACPYCAAICGIPCGCDGCVNQETCDMCCFEECESFKALFSSCCVI